MPSLFWFELTNVLVMASRRAKSVPLSLDELMKLGALLPVDTDDPPSPEVCMRIARLACDYKLTAYDASYLELAVRKKAARLVTLDQALLNLTADFSFVAR